MNFTKQKPVTLSAAANGYLNNLNKTAPVKPMTATEKYNAAKNVYANKVGYMNQHNSGNYTEAEKFRTAAAPAYSVLEKGGAGDVANTLHSSDVANAGKVVSDLGFDAYTENYRNNSGKVIDNALKKANLQLDNQKTAVNEQYDNLARQGYLNYMESKKNLPQQLKAQGMTGGLSESSQVALANNYGQQATETQKARLSALSELDMAKTGAALDAENQKLGIESDLATKGYEKLREDYGYDRQDNSLDKQLKAQKDLQADSQKWQSGESALDRTHQTALVDKEQAFNADEARKAEAHELKKLVMQFTHDTDEAALDRQLELALETAQKGDFTMMSRLTGLDKTELEQNFKNLLWLDAAYPQYAENMFPNASYIHHVSDKGGDPTNPGGNVPTVIMPW